MTKTPGKNIIKDEWLSGIFGHDVYAVILDSAFTGGTGPKSLKDLQRSRVFLYSKVSCDDLNGIGFLNDSGFYLVDTNVVFEKKISLSHGEVSLQMSRFAGSDDEDAVARIAESAFTLSRFHRDENISDTTANRIKGEWARNYFRGRRGDFMVVAENGKEMTGFLQLIKGNDHQLVIDLIAVDKAHRERGMARDMIDFAGSHCGDFRTIRVGTQLVNAKSIRFYENIGFRYVSSQYVFHYMN